MPPVLTQRAMNLGRSMPTREEILELVVAMGYRFMRLPMWFSILLALPFGVFSKELGVNVFKRPRGMLEAWLVFVCPGFCNENTKLSSCSPPLGKSAYKSAPQSCYLLVLVCVSVNK